MLFWKRVTTFTSWTCWLKKFHLVYFFHFAFCSAWTQCCVWARRKVVPAVWPAMRRCCTLKTILWLGLKYCDQAADVSMLVRYCDGPGSMTAWYLEKKPSSTGMQPEMRTLFHVDVVICLPESCRRAAGQLVFGKHMHAVTWRTETRLVKLAPTLLCLDGNPFLGGIPTGARRVVVFDACRW